MTTLAERILYCASWVCDIREVCACSSSVPFNCLSFGAGTGVCGWRWMAGAERDNVEVRRGRMRMSMHVMIQSGVTSCGWDANQQLRVALGRLVVPSFLFATGYPDPAFGHLGPLMQGFLIYTDRGERLLFSITLSLLMIYSFPHVISSISPIDSTKSRSGDLESGEDHE
jgi:hypothetical protein